MPQSPTSRASGWMIHAVLAHVMEPRYVLLGIVLSNCTERAQKIRHEDAFAESTIHPPTSATIKTQPFYAVVLYDFVAERPDELYAKAGEPISVVAQSNREWFVAKSIGRLGRPGLIPVSFVEVRDPATSQIIPDVGALMDNGTIPSVEDWKKQMLNYKASAIALPDSLC
jgi:hypothetical protein